MNFPTVSTQALAALTLLFFTASCGKKQEPAPSAAAAFHWEKVQSAPSSPVYHQTIHLPGTTGFKLVAAVTAPLPPASKLEILGTADSISGEAGQLIRYDDGTYTSDKPSKPGAAPLLESRIDFTGFSVSSDYTGAQVNEHLFPEVTGDMRPVIDHLETLHGEKVVNHFARVYKYLGTGKVLVVLAYQLE